MDAKTQIMVLLVSFLYGIFFFYSSKLNNFFIKDKNKIYRSIITILFMYNIVLLYIIMIFKINNGKFHPYFFIMLILGFLIGTKSKNKVLKNVKLKRLFEKKKKT